jgi:hypothetical protein
MPSHPQINARESFVSSASAAIRYFYKDHAIYASHSLAKLRIRLTCAYRRLAKKKKMK